MTQASPRSCRFRGAIRIDLVGSAVRAVREPKGTVGGWEGRRTVHGVLHRLGRGFLPWHSTSLVEQHWHETGVRLEGGEAVTFPLPRLCHVQVVLEGGLGSLRRGGSRLGEQMPEGQVVGKRIPDIIIAAFRKGAELLLRIGLFGTEENAVLHEEGHELTDAARFVAVFLQGHNIGM